MEIRPIADEQKLASKRSADSKRPGDRAARADGGGGGRGGRSTHATQTNIARTRAPPLRRSFVSRARFQLHHRPHNHVSSHLSAFQIISANAGCKPNRAHLTQMQNAAIFSYAHNFSMLRPQVDDDKARIFQRLLLSSAVCCACGRLFDCVCFETANKILQLLITTSRSLLLLLLVKPIDDAMAAFMSAK